MDKESAKNVLESLVKALGGKEAAISLFVEKATPMGDTMPNAWTNTQSGEIGVTTALLDLLGEEDAPLIAFIFAHELAHMYLHHKGNKVADYAENFGQELLADKYGIMHMIKAGYDPQGAIDFIIKLCEIVPDLEETSEQVAYPRPSERIAMIRQHISLQNKRRRTIVRLATRNKGRSQGGTECKHTWSYC